MELPTKYLYAIEGSDLFDKITELPEYYVFRAEISALNDAAHAIAALGEWTRLIELGAGFGRKIRILLDALSPRRDVIYSPFDINETALLQAASRLAMEYPAIQVQAYVGDFLTHDLEVVLEEGRRSLVAFLGSTLGNLTLAQRNEFYGRFSVSATRGDALLVGLDLVKDNNVIEAAYNDSAGVTAEFNLNAIRFIQQELGASVTTDDFEHRAVYLADRQVVEMRLYARRDLAISFEDPSLSSFNMASGSYILTELSYKFTRGEIERDVDSHGLRLLGWWTDTDGQTALALVGL